jgi:hypothetical protein
MGNANAAGTRLRQSFSHNLREFAGPMSDPDRRLPPTHRQARVIKARFEYGILQFFGEVFGLKDKIKFRIHGLLFPNKSLLCRECPSHASLDFAVLTKQTSCSHDVRNHLKCGSKRDHVTLRFATHALRHISMLRKCVCSDA